MCGHPRFFSTRERHEGHLFKPKIYFWSIHYSNPLHFPEWYSCLHFLQVFYLQISHSIWFFSALLINRIFSQLLLEQYIKLGSVITCYLSLNLWYFSKTFWGTIYFSSVSAGTTWHPYCGHLILLRAFWSSISDLYVSSKHSEQNLC